MKNPSWKHLPRCFAAVAAALWMAGCSTHPTRTEYPAAGPVPRTVPGNSIDLTQRENLQAQAPQTWQRIEQGQPLGLADVEALAKAGVSDDVIVSQLHISRAIYHLTTAEILELKGAGVDESVIDFMINTPNSAGGSAPATTAPPAPPPPLPQEVVVAPHPT